MNSEPRNLSQNTRQLLDHQFPDAAPGFLADNGMLKVFGHFECFVCGERTAWVNAHDAVYLCSSGCLTRYQSNQQGT